MFYRHVKTLLGRSAVEVFNTFLQSWKVFMHSVCLSVCPSVCPLSNFCKYYSNVLKLIHVIHIWHSMNCIESDLYEQWFVYRDTQKFSGKLRPKGEKCLKFILTYLYCTKYDEINIYHLCMHKNVFHIV